MLPDSRHFKDVRSGPLCMMFFRLQAVLDSSKKCRFESNIAFLFSLFFKNKHGVCVCVHDWVRIRARMYTIYSKYMCMYINVNSHKCVFFCR